MSSNEKPIQRNSDSAPTGRFQPTDSRSGTPKSAWQAKMPPGKTWWWVLVIVLANYFLARLFWPSPEAPVSVPYPVFKEEAGKRNVEAIYSRGESMTGRFKTPVTYPPASEKGGTAADGGSQKSSDRVARTGEPKPVSHFATTLPSFVGPGLEAFLIKNGVEISAKPIQEGSSPWATLLGFGPALLFIGFYVWLFRRAAQQGGGMGAGLMGIGRSKARRYDQETDAKVTFDDVAGIDEAENELIEIV